MFSALFCFAAESAIQKPPALSKETFPEIRRVIYKMRLAGAIVRLKTNDDVSCDGQGDKFLQWLRGRLCDNICASFSVKIGLRDIFANAQKVWVFEIKI